MAGGGTGQRGGEAAGISRAVCVFKRCSEKGDVPPLWVSEGGLEPHIGAISPDRGNHAIRVTRGGLTYPGILRRVPYLIATWLVRGYAAGPGICSRTAGCSAPRGTRLRGRTGLPSVMIWGHTRDAPFCRRVSSPVRRQSRAEPVVLAR
jgi:hypothetical protein